LPAFSFQLSFLLWLSLCFVFILGSPSICPCIMVVSFVFINLKMISGAPDKHRTKQGLIKCTQ